MNSLRFFSNRRFWKKWKSRNSSVNYFLMCPRENFTNVGEMSFSDIIQDPWGKGKNGRLSSRWGSKL